MKEKLAMTRSPKKPAVKAAASKRPAKAAIQKVAATPVPETLEGAPAQLGRFKTNIRRLRLARNWSQSDLARHIWGEDTDSRGFAFAKNKHLISRWESGTVPEMDNLKLVAEALEVSIEVLAPDLVTNEHADELAVAMTMVPGRPDTVRLTVNTFTTLTVASKIITLLSTDPNTNGP
ncbi:MAG: hypothetical protein BGO81_10370 [Devosia sp. 66-22]|nr:MAG: hypothetical protein BGO81_10370 [Devosia sp. 66-22]